MSRTSPFRLASAGSAAGSSDSSSSGSRCPSSSPPPSSSQSLRRFAALLAALRPAARRRSASRTASTTLGSMSPPRRLMSSRMSPSESLWRSPPLNASVRCSRRQSAMRARSSSIGSSIAASRWDPSKGSTGPRNRNCSSMTFRSHTRPEPGSRTGSSITWLMRASWNSGGSFSPSLKPPSPRSRSSISFWCSGTSNRPGEESPPGRKRAATRTAKSWPASVCSTPISPNRL
mmetsp:Transcript_96901/g.279714  ORF Transcript_96901/g.279714 Transcript_96901/m.279714 type:complete len:232 (+) Transcript_96901:495-1190(+)